MYFASSVPHAEKSQHVPLLPWSFTVEFQFAPLTLCQLKLSSANALCDDNDTPIVKSTVTEKVRQKNDLQPRISETPFQKQQVTKNNTTIIQHNHHVTQRSKKHLSTNFLNTITLFQLWKHQ